MNNIMKFKNSNEVLNQQMSKSSELKTLMNKLMNKINENKSEDQLGEIS